MATNVNLDALIPREDFEVLSANDDAPVPGTIAARNLEPGDFFYLALRKPDFQRETAEWAPKRVAGLIRTFIEGDLIPAVILWKHREYLFVIDGSHRLSALIAWVHDDYGDGDLSKKFFGDSIPQEQITFAQKTRDAVNAEVGSYADHVAAAREPGDYGPDIVARARALGSRVLTLQWVRGDELKAEKSFIRINQQAATITPQELELIEGRKLPATMAARAIIRRGSGHQSWLSFPQEQQNEIRRLAGEVHELIFAPALSYPIKSLNLPSGGAVYSATALRMIYEFVLSSVGVQTDTDENAGLRTIDYLKRCKRVAELMLSNKPSSLGLHPAIYFYSWTGKQQPILFLTIADILIEMERSKSLLNFISRREKLEEFLFENRPLLNQIIRKFGTKASGRSHLKDFYQGVFDLIDAGQSSSAIGPLLAKRSAFSYLQPGELAYSGVSPTRYSTQVKSGLVIRELIPTAPKCPICRGYVPSQAMSIDHMQRRADGGPSTVGNAQITHPYCNTGVKEGVVSKQGSSQKVRGQPGDLFNLD
ncbi:hypothetical protein D3C86_439760 [compost metagenome]